MRASNDNQPLEIGDRVQRVRFPHIQGYVFDVGGSDDDLVIVQWDDPEEIAQVRDRRLLQKITPPPDRA